MSIWLALRLFRIALNLSAVVGFCPLTAMLMLAMARAVLPHWFRRAYDVCLRDISAWLSQDKLYSIETAERTGFHEGSLEPVRFGVDVGPVGEQRLDSVDETVGGCVVERRSAERVGSVGVNQFVLQQVVDDVHFFVQDRQCE